MAGKVLQFSVNSTVLAALETEGRRSGVSPSVIAARLVRQWAAEHPADDSVLAAMEPMRGKLIAAIEAGDIDPARSYPASALAVIIGVPPDQPTTVRLARGLQNWGWTAGPMRGRTSTWYPPGRLEEGGVADTSDVPWIKLVRAFRCPPGTYRLVEVLDKIRPDVEGERDPLSLIKLRGALFALEWRPLDEDRVMTPASWGTGGLLRRKVTQ